MKTISVFIFSICFFLLSFTPGPTLAAGTITILKDGGGTELIGNSLVATTVAVTQGADFIELPVNLSSDDQLIVYRDTTLNGLTNVAELFPEKVREDGNYYVVDFSLLELRQLRLRNVFDNDVNSLSVGIASLQESLTVIDTLNTQLKKDSGIVISLTHPAFYDGEGKSLSRQLKNSLDILSYTPEKKLYIESSDPDELQKISRWSQTDNNQTFALIQTIRLEPTTGQNASDTTNRRIQDNWLFTNSGLRILASYASAVSLSQEVIDSENVDLEGFSKSLHDYDIKVFGPTAANAPTVSNSTLTKAKFDGVYLESLNNPPAPESSITERTEEGEVVETGSTLPPFFSNLGLSQPKQGGDTIDFDNNSEEEEF